MKWRCQPNLTRFPFMHIAICVKVVGDGGTPIDDTGERGFLITEITVSVSPSSVKASPSLPWLYSEL